MEFFSKQFEVAVLILARFLAMMSVAPFFSGQTLSYFYRASIAFFAALLLVPVVKITPEARDWIHQFYFLAILEQAFIGFLIGVGLQFLFAAFQMAGEFFSTQMGFGVSEVFDPMSQVSLPLMGTINNLFALFVFFISNAHIYLIKAVAYSFQKFPLMPTSYLESVAQNGTVVKFIITLTSGMFLVALKLAIPVMGTLMLVSVTLGLLSKAAPQMNILMLGFPVKIMVGFFVLMWISPAIIEIMLSQFDTYFAHVDALIRTWR